VHLATTRASAVILPPDVAAETSLAKLVHKNPYAAYAKVAALLHPPLPIVPGSIRARSYPRCASGGERHGRRARVDRRGGDDRRTRAHRRWLRDRRARDDRR
jgi:hypothetical protein